MQHRLRSPHPWIDEQVERAPYTMFASATSCCVGKLTTFEKPPVVGSSLTTVSDDAPPVPTVPSHPGFAATRPKPGASRTCRSSKAPWPRSGAALSGRTYGSRSSLGLPRPSHGHATLLPRSASEGSPAAGAAEPLTRANPLSGPLCDQVKAPSPDMPAHGTNPEAFLSRHVWRHRAT